MNKRVSLLMNMSLVHVSMCANLTQACVSKAMSLSLSMSTYAHLYMCMFDHGAMPSSVNRFVGLHERICLCLHLCAHACLCEHLCMPMSGYE